MTSSISRTTGARLWSASSETSIASSARRRAKVLGNIEIGSEPSWARESSVPSKGPVEADVDAALETAHRSTAFDAMRCAAPASPAPEMALFGQFIGDWDVEVLYHGQDGTVVRHGEWLFDWTLEGRAVIDIWRVPSRAESQRTGAPVYGLGTTIRFYDSQLGAWRSTWVGVMKGEVIPFIGRADGDDITLDHVRQDGSAIRWGFRNIASSSFGWYHQQSPNGSDWTLVQEMRARRRG
jgi:hypothetical protein